MAHTKENVPEGTVALAAGLRSSVPTAKTWETSSYSGFLFALRDLLPPAAQRASSRFYAPAGTSAPRGRPVWRCLQRARPASVCGIKPIGGCHFGQRRARVRLVHWRGWQPVLSFGAAIVLVGLDLLSAARRIEATPFLYEPS